MSACPRAACLTPRVAPSPHSPVAGLALQHELGHAHTADTKLDLRAGGGGAGGRGAGPGPPSPAPPVLTNHVAPSQSVITVKSPPAPAPAKPSLDVRPPSLSVPAPAVPQTPSPVPPAPAPAPVVRSVPPKALSPSERAGPSNNVGSDIAVTSRDPAPLLSAPPPRADLAPPSLPDPTVLRQPASLQPVGGGGADSLGRGRTPTRQERSRQAPQLTAAPQSNDIAAAPAGGYNFQKIMDDRFEHYKRPPSRERSADRQQLGSRQGSRHQLSRDPSRDRLAAQPPPAARPPSRQRTPQVGAEQTFSENKNNGLDSLDLGSAAPKPAQTGNGSVAGNSFSAEFKLPAEDQIRFRGVQQEIPHFGAPPKRTESLYMKPSNNTNQQPAAFQVTSF